MDISNHPNEECITNTTQIKTNIKDTFQNVKTITHDQFGKFWLFVQIFQIYYLMRM
jgi:NADH:ubiquinone oxidoreductase subunit 6 (subunit J)